MNELTVMVVVKKQFLTPFTFFVYHLLLIDLMKHRDIQVFFAC